MMKSKPNALEGRHSTDHREADHAAENHQDRQRRQHAISRKRKSPAPARRAVSTRAEGGQGAGFLKLISVKDGPG
jgi:hypothetical protein